MKAIDLISRFLARLRYPVSLPEDIADALGINLSNALSFKEFVRQLAAPTLKPTTLCKFMLRDQAEKVFCNAPCQERFGQSTLISYYFNEGWLEFVLKFDNQCRLRRIYLHHKEIPNEEGIELPLSR